MPKPKKGEKEADYMNRCISMLVHEGKEQEQVVAICYSMYKESRKPKGKKELSVGYLKSLERKGSV